MRIKVLPLLLVFVSIFATAQVGIGTTSPKASLDISVTNPSAPSFSDGVLIPRLEALPAIEPTDDQHAMLIFLTASSGGKNPGFHYWDKTKGVAGEWMPLKDGWKITGNDDAISGTHFLGTTNAQEVDFRVNDKLVSRFTEKGQFELEADEKSVLIGFQAGENYDPAGTAAEQNVFIGYQAAMSSTSGRDNVAVGAFSMMDNTTGNFNVGVGDETLENNTTGDNNTAVGNDALRANETGDGNTAIGRDALRFNDDGDLNTAIGLNALIVNSGDNNTAIGHDAGDANTNGSFNTFIGYNANAASGGLSNATAIGNGAIADKSNQIILGNTAVLEISGYAPYTNISDERFKHEIKDNVPGIDFINELRTVTYKLDRKKLSKFKGETILVANSENIHTGFLAQQVEAVAQKLGYDFSGIKAPKDLNSEHYTVSYSTFVVPLVKAVQEQQDQIDSQQKEIEELKKLVNQLINTK